MILICPVESDIAIAIQPPSACASGIAADATRIVIAATAGFFIGFQPCFLCNEPGLTQLVFGINLAPSRQFFPDTRFYEERGRSATRIDSRRGAGGQLNCQTPVALS